ncbi:MAG: hypothetical protein FWE23_05595 [Chitinivibrionia bacterium]|nr:hypothetical protein [Chitinivibrionia bacterium]
MKKLFVPLFAMLLLLGCASTDTPTVEYATIHFSFVPDVDLGAGTVSFSAGGATWTIDTAHVSFGDIGIHWEEDWAPRSAQRQPRHDTGGRPAALIGDGKHFAIDLLKEQYVGFSMPLPGVFSHIHKTAHNVNSLSGTGQNIVGIATPPFSETLGEGFTFYFAGKVNNGAVERNFVLRTRVAFGENDLDDTMFRLPVQADEVWDFKLSPRFAHWFGGIEVGALTADGNNIRIDGSNNTAQLTRFISRFGGTNSMDLITIKR